MYFFLKSIIAKSITYLLHSVFKKQEMTILKKSFELIHLLQTNKIRTFI